MTVQIALCDDETEELVKMEKMLNVYAQKHKGANLEIEHFESADALLMKVSGQGYSPDLVFMDIYMPGKTGKSAPLGMGAARRLRGMKSRARLIFLTTSREHALDAFDVEASSYLLKPVSEDKVVSLLDRFLAEWEEKREKYILLRVEGMITKVLLNDIVFCEAKGKHQYIYMADGSKIVQSLSMAKLYEMCRSCGALVKVGVSYIVHLEHIVSLNAHEVHMDLERTIYLPRGTYRRLREQYIDYYC